MSWTMYRITFRLLTPLHVGWFKQGNVQQTRPYVSGKALWGALTARLTREQGHQNYQKMGEQVNQQLAFSYFYPSTSNQKVDLWPWENPQEFAWRYLNTYASTALNYEKHSAEEGSLHETEYIAPFTREGEPVYLVGYLFEKEGKPIEWRAALGKLQLGGERTYGWGRVALVDKPQPTSEFWPDWKVALDDSRPRLEPCKIPACCYAHLLATQVSQIAGTLEPLVGRETSTTGQHGEQASFHGLTWLPGARLQEKRKLVIEPYGIWSADNDGANP